MQQYADIYLLQSHSTCFGVSQHLSSGVLKTVTAASSIGHDIGTATSLQCGLIGTLEGSSCTDIIPVPEAAVTVFTPDDGCCDT